MSTTNAAPRASILVPLPLDGPYDYLLSAGGRRGDLVRAPLGKREMLGVVWGPAEGGVAPEKLREAVKLEPAHRLHAPLCDFVDWVARYTLSPRGAVLAQVLRAPDAFLAERPRSAFRLGPPPEGSLTPARKRVLALMADGLARSAAEIAEVANVSPGVVKGLSEMGALRPAQLPEFDALPVPDPDHSDTVLSHEQAAAAAHLREAVVKKEYSAHLLDGVTGSGKTETYFEAVAEALAQGRQALILLPEIALTVQFLDRFAARFGCRPAEWHSDMTERTRRHTYRAVMSGEARVVVGARSALFLPFPALGLIIADEEHDSAYKQDEGVVYNARDMAVVRARLENCPVVLSSATPSLETWLNAKGGRYSWLKLSSRHGIADLPEVVLVDLREEAERGKYLSTALTESLREVVAAGEQALLFLNRRGYAPLTLCAACGHKETCRNCSAWLVEHRYRGRLVCHHCGFETKRPETCSSCNAADSLIPCGPGVERVEEELRASLPDARIAIASSDTLSSPKDMRRLLESFGRGEIDILIGTQIVAKGHHFPQLTLAGVIDADLGGVGGDPRSSERSFQVLYQVAGRAGRGDKPGRVLVQTRNPDDAVMQAIRSGARDAFFEAEAKTRERSGSPPFGRLAALLLSGTDGDLVRETARKVAVAAPKTRGIRVWGPAPAFYQMLRGRTRERLLVQAERNIDVQEYLKSWLAGQKIPSSVRLTIDIDPMSFF